MPFKSLKETSIFKYTEKMLPSAKIETVITKLIADKKNFVSSEQMEDVFYKMRHKSFNYRAKFAVIDLFNKGIIKLVYNPEVNLTVAIPFVKFKLPSGGLGTIINITPYSKKSKDGMISIDPTVLYTLMLSGMLDLVYEDNLSRLAHGGIPEIYGDLICNATSRLMNLDVAKRFIIKYLFTKFMYIQLGCNEAMAASCASVSALKAVPEVPESDVEKIDLKIPAKAYGTLESLIDALRIAIPEFSSITYGLLFEQWMKTYGESGAYGIEYAPIFLMMFIALITNCPTLVNVKAMEREANKNSNKLVTLFNLLEQFVIYRA